MRILLLAFILASAEPRPDHTSPIAPAEDARPPVGLSALPQLGHCYPAPEPTIWVVHRGGDLCSTSFRLDGFRFSLDIDCDSGLVVFIDTSDPALRIDGVGVGSTLAQALAQGGRLETDPCGVRLPSGWLAVATDGCRSSPERTEIDRFSLQEK